MAVVARAIMVSPLEREMALIAAYTSRQILIIEFLPNQKSRFVLSTKTGDRSSVARGARCCAFWKLLEDELHLVKRNFQRGRLCNGLVGVGIELVLSIRGRAEVGQSGADILYGVRYGVDWRLMGS